MENETNNAVIGGLILGAVFAAMIGGLFLLIGISLGPIGFGFIVGLGALLGANTMVQESKKKKADETKVE